MDIEGVEGGDRRNKFAQGFSQDVRNGRLDDMNEEQQSSISGRDRGSSRIDGGDLDDILVSSEVFEVNMASALSDPSVEPDTQIPGPFKQGPNPMQSEQASVNAGTRLSSSSGSSSSSSSNSNGNGNGSSSASQVNTNTSTGFSHTANSHTDESRRSANEWKRLSDQPRAVPPNKGWDALEVEHVSSQRKNGTKHVDDLWGAGYVADDHNQAVKPTSLYLHPRPSSMVSQQSSQSHHNGQQESGVPIHHGPREVESSSRGSGRAEGSKSVAQQRVQSHTQQHTLRQPVLQSAPSSQHKGLSRQLVSVNRGAMSSSSSPVNKTWDLPQLPPGMHRSPSGNPSSSSSSSSYPSSSPSIAGKSNDIMRPPHSGSRKRLRTSDSSPHSFDITGRLDDGDRIEKGNGYRVGVGVEVQERSRGAGVGEQTVVFGENGGNSNMNNRNGHHQHHNLEGQIGQNQQSAATQSSTQRNESLWGNFNMESKVQSPSPRGIFPVSNRNPVMFDYKKDLDEEEW